MTGCFPEQPRLQHHLGQLFHKQRHSIGLGHKLPEHLGRQRLTSCDSLDHDLHLFAGQTAECELGQVRASGPGRTKIRAKIQQNENAGRGCLVDQEVEKLQRGGISPLQILPHRERRLPLRFLQ